MALPNAFAQYNNSKVLTASPAELVLMLYDGAIKFCNIAIVAIENKDIQKAHTHIVKTEKIIDHFRATLDMKYPVAKDFDRVYEYVKNLCLTEPIPSTIIINNIGYLWAFINDDELVEVTPTNIRIRKKILDNDLRAKDEAKRKKQ